MRSIRLITFDLDNTLWDVDTIIRRAEQDMREWMADNTPRALDHYTADQLQNFRQRAAAEFADQVHDLSFMRIQVLTYVMRAAGYQRNATALAKAAFEVFFEGRNRVEFFPGALETLATLKSRYTLYALTNGNADIARAGLSDYLDEAISAADVGARKPDRRMFAEPLARVGVAPTQAIHIGDHLEDDVAGALDSGMHAIWVNFDKSELQPDVRPPSRTVHHLVDIVDAVDAIERGKV